MKVVLSPQAREDLREIFLTIAEDNSHAAGLILTRIKERVAELTNNPHIGRPGRVPGTRELVISKTPSIVPYQVSGDTLQILRVYHGSRQWPEHFA